MTRGLGQEKMSDCTRVLETSQMEKTVITGMSRNLAISGPENMCVVSLDLSRNLAEGTELARFWTCLTPLETD